MATITAHVIPRSRRPSVQATSAGELMIRVRAVPSEGRATREAARALAAAVGVAPSAITLRRGARSRTKIFVVEGLSEQDLAARIQGL